MPNVSVIVPSFNRAHLLHLTLPSYLQPQVGELILVDDCSEDNTEEVVKELQKKFPQIRYFKNEVNSKQGFSKNVGLQNAVGEFIYFGDDDSIITNGTIKALLQTQRETNADVAGARPMTAGSYVRNFNEIDAFVKWTSKKRVAKNEKDICDLENMSFKFGLNFHYPVVVIVVANSCALVKSEVAKKFRFDPAYVGSAYREETDYWIQIALADHKFVFEPRAVQVNLPSNMVKLTGARTGGFERWKESTIANNKYFLDKNWNKICDKFGYAKSVEEMQKKFETEIGQKKKSDLSGDSVIKVFLKRIYFKAVIC